MVSGCLLPAAELAALLRRLEGASRRPPCAHCRITQTNNHYVPASKPPPSPAAATTPPTTPPIMAPVLLPPPPPVVSTGAGAGEATGAGAAGDPTGGEGGAVLGSGLSPGQSGSEKPGSEARKKSLDWLL